MCLWFAQIMIEPVFGIFNFPIILGLYHNTNGVVTKDIPANVVAVGNPCKVLREIGEKDREYYFKERKIPDEWFRD